MDCNKTIHPRRDDHGGRVTIHHPSNPTPFEAFGDPEQVVVVVPDGKTPEVLNGIPLDSWDSAPRSLADWAQVAGQTLIDEPVIAPKSGKKLSAGVITVEPDGRVWLVAPTNAFGGYQATFPKGTIDSGLSAQAAAIKEAFEESGLRVAITAWVGDFERTTSVTRYYFARRTGGDPAMMGWESQAVILAPADKLFGVLNHAKDHELLKAALPRLKAENAPVDFARLN
jgi:8-oxo-dGTP pyrophosphatase MutT (NUDIX family)